MYYVFINYVIYKDKYIKFTTINLLYSKFVKKCNFSSLLMIIIMMEKIIHVIYFKISNGIDYCSLVGNKLTIMIISYGTIFSCDYTNYFQTKSPFKSSSMRTTKNLKISI